MSTRSPRDSKSRTVLLTLGRLPVALELLRALKASGWRVLVADPYAWHLCRLSNSVHRCFRVTVPATDKESYLAELMQIVLRERVSLVLPVSEETLYVSLLKSRLATSVKVMCMDHHTLMQLHDKFSFVKFAKELGLPVPKTALADDAMTCNEIMSDSFVVKPRQSCSGAGVRFGSSGGVLDASEASDKLVVQQRLSGKSCCSFSVAVAGQTVINVCYETLLEAGTVAICFEQVAMPGQIRTFVDTVVKATDYTGMIAFDFIQDDEATWRAIECNPRATSGIHFVEQTNIVAALINGEMLARVSGSERVFDRRQEFWSCLMQVEGALFKGKINRQGWRHLFAARDITLKMSDIKPFLFMTIVMAPQLLRSIKSGKPMSQILMNDLTWQEQES